MNRDVFIRDLRRCIEKAFIDDVWTFSGDPDENSEITIDENDHIQLYKLKSEYTCHDVKYIKYGINEVDEDYYISMRFHNGDTMNLGCSNSQKYLVLLPCVTKLSYETLDQEKN